MKFSKERRQKAKEVYPLPFFEEEYRERLQKTRSKMEEKGLDVLVVSDPANMCYLSGYNAWSFYVPQVLILFQSEEEPYWIGRESDLNGAKITTFLGEDRLLGYPESYVQSVEHHPMDFVAEWLKDKGRSDMVIGLEMDSYYFTAACQNAFTNYFPGANYVDATGLVNWIRIIKSPQEIKYIKQAAQIVERAMQVAIDSINPGIRQCDAVSAIYQAQIEGTEEFGGDYTAIVPMLPTGIGSSAPHITWSDRKFVKGEGTIIEIAGARHRYHCPLARTVFLGQPPEKMMEMEEAMVEGVNKALDFIEPGVTAEAIEEVWRNHISKKGFVKESRLGYSIGLNYPPDWGEHTMSLRPGDKTILKENMTFHLMPGIWLDDWGIEISEPVLVTKKGAERLTNFPQKIFVKP